MFPVHICCASHMQAKYRNIFLKNKERQNHFFPILFLERIFVVVKMHLKFNLPSNILHQTIQHPCKRTLLPTTINRNANNIEDMVWWPTPVTPVLWSLRQDDYRSVRITWTTKLEFQSSLGYKVKSCQNKKWEGKMCNPRIYQWLPVKTQHSRPGDGASEWEVLLSNNVSKQGC